MFFYSVDHPGHGEHTFGKDRECLRSFNFLRQLSLSFGTNLGTTIWDHRASFRDHRLNAEVTIYNPATNEWLRQIQSLGFSADQAHASLAHAIQEQAFMLVTNDISLGSIWIFSALIVVSA